MKIDAGKIALFDDDLIGSDMRSWRRQMIDGPQHGPLGPAHFGTITEPEYPYQLDILFQEVVEDYPQVIRAVAWDGRKWTKRYGRFVLEVGQCKMN